MPEILNQTDNDFVDPISNEDIAAASDASSTNSDATGAGALLASIPEGSQYDPIRNAIKRIAETFPDELGEITASRISGWIAEVDGGEGRSADDIRDDIFRVVVGREVIMEVLGVTAEEADALIVGGNDGGMNFSDLNIATGPDGSVVAPPGDPAGIMSGGSIMQMVDDDGNVTYVQVYEVGGVSHVYTYEDWKEVIAINGAGAAITNPNDPLDYEDDVLNPDSGLWIIGEAGGLIGSEGSYGVFWETQLTEAAIEAGVRDPNRLARLYDDPEVQAIIARGAATGASKAAIQAEIRNTGAYLDLYPGIENILASGSADPEAEWRQYYNSVEESLSALGYERDENGNFDTEVGEMLTAGITAEEFNVMAPTFVRAQQSPEYAAALNAWVLNDTGSALTFEDWFDVLADTTTPEMDAIVEKATLQFQADMATTTLSQDQITRLAELTQLSEQQMTLAFSNAEEALLSVGDTDLERYGLSQQQLVNAAFGVDTDGQSATDVNRQARKAAQELGIQDDSERGFFLGFDRMSRPVRQGLTAVSPERG